MCMGLSSYDFPVVSQIRDLNAGSFGFVQLARDKLSGKKVAIKFIERGEKVCMFVLLSTYLQ